jgi:hypothetical protein
MNFLRENNFQKYSQEFLKNLGTMTDHKKAKLTVSINNKKSIKPNIYLKTAETHQSPTVKIRNHRIDILKSPTNCSNRTSVDSTNFLNRYKSLLPRISKGESLKTSKDEIVKSFDKFKIKSPGHKRNQTLNFMENGDFYYLK